MSEKIKGSPSEERENETEDIVVRREGDFRLTGVEPY